MLYWFLLIHYILIRKSYETKKSFYLEFRFQIRR